MKTLAAIFGYAVAGLLVVTTAACSRTQPAAPGETIFSVQNIGTDTLGFNVATIEASAIPQIRDGPFHVSVLKYKPLAPQETVSISSQNIEGFQPTSGLVIYLYTVHKDSVSLVKVDRFTYNALQASRNLAKVSLVPTP
jgi:hypothetical protein